MKWSPYRLIDSRTGVAVQLKHCHVSDCGQYTVAKYATARGWVYQAWKGKTFLHLADNAAECKQVCEVDCNGLPLDRR